MWRGSGQKWRQVRVQRVLWLGTKCEDLQSRIQTPQLLLQTVIKNRKKYIRTQNADNIFAMLLFLNRDYEQSDMPCCWSVFALVYIYLGDRAFFGMKAKSSKGKNSFGPIIPNPFVRFEWSLGKELKYVEISMTFKLKVSLLMILIVQVLQMNGKEVSGRWRNLRNFMDFWVRLTREVSPDRRWHMRTETSLPAQGAWCPATLKQITFSLV